MQKNDCDRMAGYVFTIPAIVVYAVGQYIPWNIYFHVAGAVDVVTLLFLLKINSRLSFCLSACVFVSILLNFGGYILCSKYYPDYFYVISFSVYYAVAAYLSLSKGSFEWNLSREYPGLSFSSCTPGQS